MKITTVQAQESGERIDALLARSGYTRSAAARLIAAGQGDRAAQLLDDGLRRFVTTL